MGLIWKRNIAKANISSSITRKDGIQETCSAVFSGIDRNYQNTDRFLSKVVATTKKVFSNGISDSVVECFSERKREFSSCNTVGTEEEEETVQPLYPVEYLKAVTVGSAVLDHVIKLRKVIIERVIRNIYFIKEYANSAKYIVAKMAKNTLQLILDTGVKSGSRLCVSLLSCSPIGVQFLIQGFLRLQFPDRVCFRIFSNKAQE